MMDGNDRYGPQVSLVDLLDRLLVAGVVLRGELLISVAGVDLVRISLNALLASVGTVRPPDEVLARPSIGFFG